ncbi:MAG: hypothetical protein LBJ89_01365, partial [Holosporales bacterium]|jgi:hypothetical protein|nr:hypothetical protein [Holosporales bacterium]
MIFHYYLNSLVQIFHANLQISIYTELALQEENEPNEYVKTLTTLPNGENYYKSECFENL